MVFGGLGQFGSVGGRSAAVVWLPVVVCAWLMWSHYIGQPRRVGGLAIYM